MRRQSPFGENFIKFKWLDYDELEYFGPINDPIEFF